MKTKWMRRMALVMAGTMLLAGTAGCTKQAAPAAVDGGGSAKQGMWTTERMWWESAGPVWLLRRHRY